MKTIIILNILALIVAVLCAQQKNYFEFVMFTAACFINIGSLLFSPALYVIYSKK